MTNSHPKVLVTCPPMLGQIDRFYQSASASGIELVPAAVTQVLSEEELIEILPNYEGWIIGDDPATRRVFEAGAAGKLCAAVKWGIGVDNVDFVACKDLGIPIINTPMMFGQEVADVALGYILSLARQLHAIDHGIRAGNWPKPAGMSLSGKTMALVGYGDIGRQVAKRGTCLGMNVIVYDPFVKAESIDSTVELQAWPNRVDEADFVVFTCALTSKNTHMFNDEIIKLCKSTAYVVNVARGPLIDEEALTLALEQGRLAGAALDVFEAEPLPLSSRLRKLPCCIFGSHNGSNTVDAVQRASLRSIELISGFLSQIQQKE